MKCSYFFLLSAHDTPYLNNSGRSASWYPLIFRVERLQGASSDCYCGLYFRLQITKFFEDGKDTLDALLDCFFARFDYQFRMLRLLVGIIYAGKARDLALVHQLV